MNKIIFWSFWTAPIWLLLIIIYLYINYFYTLVFTFLIYLYITWDGSEFTPHARYSKTFAFSSLWNYFLNYFPINVIREGKLLDPSKRYIFSLHPHGLVGFSRLTLCSGNVWNNFFPNVHCRLLAASVVFYIPVYRDFALALGMIDASKETAKKALEAFDPESNIPLSLAVVPGGISGQMRTNHKQDSVFLSKRMGFCKLALEYGCDIIPAYGFGESQTYVVNRTLQDLRIWIGDNLRIALIAGMGPLKFLPWVPFSTPLTLVFGEPICVKRITNPSSQDIIKLHSIYIEKLRNLYDKYKHKFGGSEELLVF